MSSLSTVLFALFLALIANGSLSFKNSFNKNVWFNSKPESSSATLGNGLNYQFSLPWNSRSSNARPLPRSDAYSPSFSSSEERVNLAPGRLGPAPPSEGSVASRGNLGENGILNRLNDGDGSSWGQGQRFRSTKFRSPTNQLPKNIDAPSGATGGSVEVKGNLGGSGNSNRPNNGGLSSWQASDFPSSTERVNSESRKFEVNPQVGQSVEVTGNLGGSGNSNRPNNGGFSSWDFSSSTEGVNSESRKFEVNPQVGQSVEVTGNLGGSGNSNRPNNGGFSSWDFSSSTEGVNSESRKFEVNPQVGQSVEVTGNLGGSGNSNRPNNGGFSSWSFKPKYRPTKIGGNPTGNTYTPPSRSNSWNNYGNGPSNGLNSGGSFSLQHGIPTGNVGLSHGSGLSNEVNGRGSYSFGGHSSFYPINFNTHPSANSGASSGNEFSNGGNSGGSPSVRNRRRFYPTNFGNKPSTNRFPNGGNSGGSFSLHDHSSFFPINFGIKPSGNSGSVTITDPTNPNTGTTYVHSTPTSNSVDATAKIQEMINNGLRIYEYYRREIVGLYSSGIDVGYHSSNEYHKKFINRYETGIAKMINTTMQGSQCMSAAFEFHETLYNGTNELHQCLNNFLTWPEDVAHHLDEVYHSLANQLEQWKNPGHFCVGTSSYGFSTGIMQLCTQDEIYNSARAIYDQISPALQQAARRFPNWRITATTIASCLNEVDRRIMYAFTLLDCQALLACTKT